MEKDDKGSTLIRIGVSGWKFLLVPADPGCPGSKAVKRSLLLSVTDQWFRCSESNRFWHWTQRNRFLLWWITRHFIIVNIKYVLISDFQWRLTFNNAAGALYTVSSVHWCPFCEFSRKDPQLIVRLQRFECVLLLSVQVQQNLRYIVMMKIEWVVISTATERSVVDYADHYTCG